MVTYFVLVGVSVPHLLESAFTLLSRATSGVALIVAGLTIAARKIIVSLEVGVNTVPKMRAQLALFLLLALGIKHPYGHEGFLLTVLPLGPMGVLLATRYKTVGSVVDADAVQRLLLDCRSTRRPLASSSPSRARKASPKRFRGRL